MERLNDSIRPIAGVIRLQKLFGDSSTVREGVLNIFLKKRLEFGASQNLNKRAHFPKQVTLMLSKLEFKDRKEKRTLPLKHTSTPTDKVVSKYTNNANCIRFQVVQLGSATLLALVEKYYRRRR